MSRREKIREMEQEIRELTEKLEKTETLMKRLCKDWEAERAARKKTEEILRKDIAVLQDKVAENTVEIERIRKELEEKKEDGRKSEEKQAEEKKKKMEEEYRREKEEWKERTVLIKKNESWKEQKVEELVKEYVRDGSWKFKKIAEGIGMVEFEKKEDRNAMLKEREQIGRRGRYTIDEWLDRDERADRFNLQEKAREIEANARKWRLKMEIVKESRRVKINGIWYRWNREKKELEVLKAEKREDDVAE